MLLGWGMDAFTESIERNRMKLTKEELIEALKNNVCTVTFTKVNGEVRVMPCTLRADKIASVKSLKEVIVNEVAVKPTISVWCTDAGAWRSFRFDSVTDVTIEVELHGFDGELND